MSMPSPSLPPKVKGDQIGTMSIRLKQCSASNIFARIQFWGEQSFIDLYPTNEIEYSLLGSIQGLQNYLSDASPLPIHFFLPRNSSRRNLTPRGNAHADAYLLGSGFIPDVRIPLRDSFDETAGTGPLHFAHELVVEILRSHSETKQSVIGKAIVDVTWKILPERNNPMIDIRLRNHTALKEISNSSLCHSHEKITNIEQRSGCLTENTISEKSLPRPYESSHLTTLEEVESLLGQGSCCEEKQSLLEELLELCSDDVTVPIDDLNSTTSDPGCLDPYEIWLSRITNNAGSPLSQEHPPAIRSKPIPTVQKIRVSRIEIDGIPFSTEVGGKIERPEATYPQPPPQTSPMINTQTKSRLEEDGEVCRDNIIYEPVEVDPVDEQIPMPRSSILRTSSNSLVSTNDKSSESVLSDFSHTKQAFESRQQVNGELSETKPVSTIQEWWRKKRTKLTELRHNQNSTNIDLDRSVSMKSTRSGQSLISGGKRKITTKPTLRRNQSDSDIDSPGTRDHVDPSSPDSVFEEWSRQSKTASKCIGNRAPSCSFNSNASPLEIMSSIECKENCDASNVTEDAPWVCEGDNHTCDDDLDIYVQLGVMSKVKYTISCWCVGSKKGQMLLDDSGLFVMYEVGDNSQFAPEADELSRFCTSGNVLHSSLIQTKKLSEEVNLGILARMQISNCENDLALIRSQFLRIQLWFVPIITTRIAAILNENSTRDFKALDGCSLIAVAKVPLYHLYTMKGHFQDKVPLELPLRSMECGIDRQDGHLRTDLLQSHITVSVYRVGQQISEFESKDDEPDNHTHSTPHNEARRSQIDPPGEKSTVKSIREPLSGKKRKRVSIPHSVSGSKRHKHFSHLQATVSDQIDSNCASLTPSETTQNRNTYTASSHEQLGACTIESRATEEGNESRNDETVEIDDDHSLSYRSLSSVMESLANINAKFQIAMPDCIPPTKLDQGPSNDFFEIEDPDRENEKGVAKTWNESPEVTPQKSSVLVQTIFGNTSTCEKASSPMKCTLDNVDASTSPPEKEESMEKKDRSMGTKSTKHQSNDEPGTSCVERGFNRRCSDTIDADKDVNRVCVYCSREIIDSIFDKSQPKHDISQKLHSLAPHSTQKNQSFKERLERNIFATNHRRTCFKPRMQSNYRSYLETPTAQRKSSEFRLFDENARSAYSARRAGGANRRNISVPCVDGSNFRRKDATELSIDRSKIGKGREEFSDEARRIERIFSGKM